MKRLLLAALATGAVTAFAAGASVSHVNGEIRIPAGTEAGDLSTVNGSINIGVNAKVGNVRSVNGGQSLGDGASAGNMSTVNGGIGIGRNARINGELRSVNGGLTLGAGTELNGALTNVNGAIRIDGAHLTGAITTVGGDITVMNGGRVDGGILVQKPSGSWLVGIVTVPRIVIGAGSSVGGTLKFEREVKLYVSDQAKLVGKIEGATPVKFTGATPPN